MFHADGEFMGWVPTEHLDEVAPACRASPDDWLVTGGDALLIASFEKDGESNWAVKPGETVAFSGLTKFDRVLLTWRGPGDFDHSPVPAGASMFWLPFDTDTMMDTLEGFVRENESNGGFEPGETYDVDCYDWSDASFVLRNGKFERVAESAGAA